MEGKLTDTSVVLKDLYPISASLQFLYIFSSSFHFVTTPCSSTIMLSVSFVQQSKMRSRGRKKVIRHEVCYITCCRAEEMVTSVQSSRNLVFPLSFWLLYWIKVRQQLGKSSPLKNTFLALSTQYYLNPDNSNPLLFLSTHLDYQFTALYSYPCDIL